jgi:hypothetical protein
MGSHPDGFASLLWPKVRQRRGRGGRRRGYFGGLEEARDRRSIRLQRASEKVLGQRCMRAQDFVDLVEIDREANLFENVDCIAPAVTE